MPDNEYIKTPKPEPTPIFDRWKHCPDCGDARTELRVDYDERSAATNREGVRAVTLETQMIAVHFFCLACGLTSERRETRLEDLR